VDTPAPLVSCELLAQHLSDPAWVVVDCRHDIADSEKGLREYGKGHIAGAYFAHIDRDLSGPVGDGRKGRHPLQIPGAFQRFAGNLGITAQTQVVCYDDAAGQWASRLWWLLRHYGHAKVAVLDGGLTRWKALKLPVKAGHETPRKTVPFTGQPGHMPVADTAAVEALVANPDPARRLVDVRLAERFRGDVEPVDRRAGHIPGAVNLPFNGNVGPDLRFLAPDELRARYEAALGPVAAGGVVCYCGSGVTGTHDVLAMELAGLGTAALYPGSWSEWSFPAAARPLVAGPADQAPKA
jgi:thiosulfate/3-mercaptopyruvate sulfurtransferase